MLQADRLTENWYVTAADVAALTQVSLQPIITVHFMPASCHLAHRQKASNYSLTDTLTASNIKAWAQAEATALNVPVRFLHELRTLLPQAVTDDTGDEEDAWADPNIDSAKLAEVSSDSEEEGYSETSELQTALMAAPQMIAATSGTSTVKNNSVLPLMTIGCLLHASLRTERLKCVLMYTVVYSFVQTLV